MVDQPVDRGCVEAQVESSRPRRRRNLDKVRRETARGEEAPQFLQSRLHSVRFACASGAEQKQAQRLHALQQGRRAGCLQRAEWHSGDGVQQRGGVAQYDVHEQLLEVVGQEVPVQRRVLVGGRRLFDRLPRAAGSVQGQRRFASVVVVVLRVHVDLQGLQPHDATFGVHVWAQGAVLLPRRAVRALPVVAVTQVRVGLLRLRSGVCGGLPTLDKSKLRFVRARVRELGPLFVL